MRQTDSTSTTQALVEEYTEITAEQAYCHARVVTLGVQRAIIAATLSNQGHSLTQVAELLSLDGKANDGGKARAQQLVEKGRAAMTDSAPMLAAGHKQIDTL